MAFVKVIYTVHVSLAILNSSTIDFLVTLYWIHLYIKTASKDYLIFLKQAILIIRRIKVEPSKTNQFWAQNNVNMEWIQKQSVKCTYTSKPQMSSPVPNWNPFQHTSACINVLQIFHCFSSNKCNSWTNTHQYEYWCQLNCRKLN